MFSLFLLFTVFMLGIRVLKSCESTSYWRFLRIFADDLRVNSIRLHLQEGRIQRRPQHRREDHRWRTWLVREADWVRLPFPFSPPLPYPTPNTQTYPTYPSGQYPVRTSLSSPLRSVESEREDSKNHNLIIVLCIEARSIQSTRTKQTD